MSIVRASHRSMGTRVRVVLVVATCALCVAPASVLADSPLWSLRRRPGLVANHLLAAIVEPSAWPPEPPSPALSAVGTERLARALEEVCGPMPGAREQRYAAWILEAAHAWDIDPFLLGALAYRMGRCRPDARDWGGLGLTSLRREMYSEHLRGGQLRFHVEQNGRWVERILRVDRFPFAEPRLLRAQENLYFAGAVLAMWRAQEASVHRRLPAQAAHRHFVSHFVWGDRVRSHWQESQILTDRRRLLEAYGVHRPPVLHRFGLALRAPLDGAPRVVLSGLGEGRQDGARRHRGVDLDSLPGEPVRAIADGRVTFAGVDLPGGEHRNLRRDEYDLVSRSRLGPGGRYVCVQHETEDGRWLRSCSMHLEAVEVEWGQRVRAGDRLGTVGRTGMQDSAAHLHFELQDASGLLDPAEHLQGLLLGRGAEAAERALRRQPPRGTSAVRTADSGGDEPSRADPGEPVG
ncbi:MAG: M23 family metallopeptidase [Myxococcales bacterium]|nr:M23 family metallopeptidase [Myxococcales bacterium]